MRILIDLSDETIKKIRRIAKRNGRSRKKQMETILEEFEDSRLSSNDP